MNEFINENENNNVGIIIDKNSQSLFLDLVKKKSLYKLPDININKSIMTFEKEYGDSSEMIDINKEFKFEKMISKSSHVYKDVSFLKNLCFNIFKMGNKNSESYTKLMTFNNGVYILNKNLDLTRYLKNLQMTRMMGKLLLKGNQRHYIKNCYKSILDKDYNFDYKKKEKRHQEKYEKLVEYLKKIGKKNYENIGKMDKMLIENTFNC